jgi:hypothetical protein
MSERTRSPSQASQTATSEPLDGRHDGVAATSADGTSPERWLYAGESVVVTESLAAGWVAVTSHRLLVYTPGTDGPAFTTYERPNVAGVRLDSGGDDRYLAVLPRLVVYGLVSVGGWAAFRQAGLADLLAVDAGDSLAVVGMAGLFDTVRSGLQFLEVALLVAGLSTLAGAAVLGGLYLRSRASRLVVDAAGEEPVTHSLPDGVAAGSVSLDRVRRALTQE